MNNFSIDNSIYKVFHKLQKIPKFNLAFSINNLTIISLRNCDNNKTFDSSFDDAVKIEIKLHQR